MQNKARVISDDASRVPHATPLTSSTGCQSPAIEEIGAYWNKRARSYSEQLIRNETEAPWARELMTHFRSDTKSVLDVGTGPGFFAILLARRGFSVTAADYSSSMLDIARKNAGQLRDSIAFVRVDAQETCFEDGSFDAVVTRNLTWNLPDPERAYREWHRILRRGGVLINFDANWYSFLFDPVKAKEFRDDRDAVKKAGLQDCQDYCECNIMDEIARTLPLGRQQRPSWDLRILRSIGFRDVRADCSAGERLWSYEEKVNNASTPLFSVSAVK